MDGDGTLDGVELPALFLLNANVQLVDLVDGLTLSLTGRNMLFHEYDVAVVSEDVSPSVKAPGMPFSIFLGAQYDF